MRLFSWLRERIGGERPPPSARQRGARGRLAPRVRPGLEVLEDRCLLSGGVLDPTFGTGGVVTTVAGSGGDPFAMATYPQAGTANDGKIVVVGYAYPVSGRSLSTEAAVLRYNLDGTLDTSFGSAGQVLGTLDAARAVAIQPDGKILAAGASGNNFAVARYNANGSLDNTFGSRGVVSTDITSKSVDEIMAIGLQADGKIVVAGETTPAKSSSHELAVVRYNTDGSLDTSFGTGGKALDHLATEFVGGLAAKGMGLAIDPITGKIVVEAPSPTDAAMVVSYTSAGALDATFAGGAGNVTLAGLHSFSAVAIQAWDHRILVSGWSVPGYESLARLNPDGTMDTAFGVGGMVLTPNGGVAGQVQSVKIQADGRILVGATSGAVNTVTRYNPTDGSLDTSFGVNGVATTPYDSSSSGTYFADMALEPDGRIVVVGYTTLGPLQFVVARFLATGPQVGSFTASTNPDGSVTLTASNVAALNPGSAITQVAFYLDTNGDGVLDTGDTLLGDGAYQASTNTWTFTFTPSAYGLLSGTTYTFFAVAADSYGLTSDPLQTTDTMT